MGEVLQVQADFSGFEEVIKKMKEVLKPFESLRAGGIGGGSPNNNTKPDKKNLFADNLNTSNKSLKEQNKLLGINIQKLNLIKLLTSKLKWGALGLGGLAAGGITAVIAAMNGTLQTNTRAKNTGLNFGEANALEFAGKMTGIGEDTLISSIESLQTSLKDYSKWGDLASLGLNAQNLEKKNPTEALFEVLESMKDSGLPQHMKKQIIDNLGIPFDQFQFVLKEGTGEMQKYFKEGMGMFGGKSGKSLMAGERALIRFTTILKDVSQNIGGKIAPALTTGLKLITPYIYKLADGFTWLLGKIFSESNLNAISNFFNSGIFKDLGDYLKVIFKGLLDIWETISPTLLSIVKWFSVNILPPLKRLISNLILQFKYFYNRLKPVIQPIIKYIGELAKTLMNTFADITGDKDGENPLKTIIDTLVNLLTPLSKAFEILTPLVSGLGDIIQLTVSIINGILTPFNDIMTLINKGDWKAVLDWFTTTDNKVTLTEEAKNSLKSNPLNNYKNAFNTVYNGIGYDQASLDILMNAFKEGLMTEKEKKRLWNTIGKQTAAKYGYTKEDFVNDAVITKTGQVIHTSPQDYIFAMKRPQDLAVAGASQSGGYTVNIYNPVVKDDKDIRQLKNELERLIRSFNSKR